MAAVQTRLDFIPTKRGGVNVLWNDYKYRLNRKKDDWSSWKCTVANCRARICTTNNLLTHVGEHAHNHEINAFKRQVEEVKSRIRKRAREELTPLPTIYDDEVTALHDQSPLEAAHFPTFYSVRAGLYRQRRKMIPQIPKLRRDIILEDEWTETGSGAPFLLSNDGSDDKILLFATSENIKSLCQSSTVFCDGTFYIAPSIFDQLYTIHGIVSGKTFPLVYALLPNRQQSTYERMLR